MAARHHQVGRANRKLRRDTAGALAEVSDLQQQVSDLQQQLALLGELIICLCSPTDRPETLNGRHP